MAMISNSISPHIGKATEPFVQKILRFILDRCFKKHLRKKTYIEEEMAKNNPPPEEEDEGKTEGGETG